jgi:hypothetical protein
MLQSFDPRNADLIVNINGRLVHRNEAGVSPFDSVVQGGDAVWEGLRVYDGRIFRLREHLERLRHSALALAFGQIPDAAAITTEIRRTLAANRMTDGVHIRLTLTRGVKITSGMDPRLNQSGPTLIVLAEHKPPVYGTSGLTLKTAAIRRFPPDCLDPKIHHNNLLQSILAKIEATAAGADDALMLDTRGFIAETNATHLFFVEVAELGRHLVEEAEFAGMHHAVFVQAEAQEHGFLDPLVDGPLADPLAFGDADAAGVQVGDHAFDDVADLRAVGRIDRCAALPSEFDHRLKVFTHGCLL